MSRSAHRLAIAWTILAALFLMFAPIYSGQSTMAGPDGVMVQSMDPRQSLLEMNGPRALLAIAFPLLFVLAPLLASDPTLRRQIGIFGTILMFGFVIIGGFSIGLFYLPAAIAMLVFVLTAKRQAGELPAQ